MWELAKGVMLSLVTMGMGYLIKTVRLLEFETREIKLVVSGAGGEDGLRGDSKLHNVRLDVLEAWRIKLDTAAAIEHELYEGEERRQQSRRLRDRILEQDIASLPKIKGE